jgi:plastocyanin
MKMRFSAANILLLFICQSALAEASIDGRVTLPETRSAPVIHKRYEVVSKGGVVSTLPPLAVVYLEGDFKKELPQTTQQVVQKDLTFVPALLAVQTGTKVEFPNQDNVYHNIFSYSPTKRFDLGRYRQDERPIPAIVFDKPGLVTLRCDIHEHMRGLILVLDTPYFTTTDPEGRFRLTKLPSGQFTLKAWIDSRTTKAQPVELTNDRTLHIDFP